MSTRLGYVRSRAAKAWAHLAYVPRALGLVWRAAPRHMVAWAALLIVQGLLPVATVWVTRVLVNALAAAIGQGESALTMALALWAGLLAALLVGQELLRGAIEWVRTAQAERTQDHIADLVHQQSAAVDLAFYDSPDYYDQLHRARSEAVYRPAALLESLGAILQGAITLAGMGVILWRYGWWVPIVLLVSALPGLYAVLRHYEQAHDWRQQTTPRERRAWYYSWLLTTREAAAEVRLFGLAERLRQAYRALRQGLYRERLGLLRRRAGTRAVASLLALAAMGGTMVWMLRRASIGHATLGDLVLFYQAFAQGQGLTRALLENLGQLYSSTLFLADLFAFLALTPSIGDPAGAASPPLTLERGIRLEEVTFAYPGSGQPTLKGLNLSISAGQVVGLVGPNGAGKSTLVKLLCRFYVPASGRITWDGRSLDEFRLDDLRRAVAVLFQEPMRYQATVRENIALGDAAGLDAGDLSAVTSAATAAGADGLIAALPQGYETLLGKWFAGGTDLSVGEWQRLALARAFLRRAPLVILDEPTSAMDSWAEADWMGRFRELVAGRTALVITHRLTTAMRADVIHVLEGQRIVESGSHQELLALRGRYAASWQAQMRGAPGAMPSGPQS